MNLELIENLKKTVDKSYSFFEKLLEDDKEQNVLLSKTLFRLLSFAALAVIIFLILDLILISFTEKGGVFGDFFGGVLNPIFTFLTFFGLIVTIVIQRQELKLARVEFAKTAEALNVQAIETTFFNILDLHHKIVDNMKVDLKEFEKNTVLKQATRMSQEILASYMKISTDTVFNGRNVFDAILNFITHNTSSPEEVKKRYKFIQDEYNHILGHYFRNLYQALKVIDKYEEDVLSEEKKRKYTSILRAQLSTKELAILFLNSLDGVSDSGQFKNLLIKYSMLEHLPIEESQENEFILKGNKMVIADKKMILEYKYIKKFGLNLEKSFNGAFGNNKGIPYNLK